MRNASFFSILYSISIPPRTVNWKESLGKGFSVLFFFTSDGLIPAQSRKARENPSTDSYPYLKAVSVTLKPPWSKSKVALDSFRFRIYSPNDIPERKENILRK